MDSQARILEWSILVLLFRADLFGAPEAPHSAGELPHSLMTIGSLPFWGLIFQENMVSFTDPKEGGLIYQNQNLIYQNIIRLVYFFLEIVEVQRQIIEKWSQGKIAILDISPWLVVANTFSKTFQTPKPYGICQMLNYNSAPIKR